MLRRLLLVSLSVGCSFSLCSTARGAPAPLTLTQTVQLPQITDGTNHLAADAKRHRFFVTAPGDKKLVVVDLKAGQVLREIEGPAAAAVFLPDLDQLCVSGGGGVAFYAGDSLAPLGKVDLHTSVDELQYDPRSKRVFVGVMDAKNPGIAMIDPAGRKLLQTMKLPARPQGFVLEREGAKLYANTPAAQEVTVLDRDRGTTVAEWKLPQAEGNYPIALDEEGHRLFVGCRRPAQVLVLDTASGKPVASVETGGDADDMSFDPKARRAYLACGEGVISCVQESDGERYDRLADTPTAEGARNSLFVPELDTFYVAIPKHANGPAELSAYRSRDGKSPASK